jgi:hypothetical protein
MMNARPRSRLLAGLLLALVASSPLGAQVLHTNNRWDECAIVIDPSLTQDAWHQFVAEVGQVAYFRPLTSARPLGRGRVELAILNSGTGIDDADAAWNDTFSHPDSTHWLFEGNALVIPGLMARVGVSDRIDVGAYYTQNFAANYGIAGGQVQYSLLGDPARYLAAAGRVSAAWLFGPEDLGASVYGLDFVVSRDLSIFSPYVGVSGYLSRGREHTSKVTLEDENIFGVQGMVGVAVRYSVLRLGGEVSLGRVPGYSFKVALGT